MSIGQNGGYTPGYIKPSMNFYVANPDVGQEALMGVSSGTSASVSLFPFVLPNNLNAGVMNSPMSVSFVTNGTSSGQQTYGFQYGLYTNNAGTLSRVMSGALSYGVTANNSTISINQPTTTNYTGYGTGSTTSAGFNITSGYTGIKVLGFPINQYLPSGQYWFGIMATASTSSINCGLSFSFQGSSQALTAPGAPIGGFSSANTTGLNYQGQLRVGYGVWSSAGSVTGLPVAMAGNSITQSGNTAPIFSFYST